MICNSCQKDCEEYVTEICKECADKMDYYLERDYLDLEDIE